MSALFWRRIIKIGLGLDCSIFPVKIHIILSNYLHKHLRIGSTGICVSALQDPSMAGIPGLSLPWLAWNLPRKCLLACQAHCHGSSAIRCCPDIKIEKSNTEGIFESSVQSNQKHLHSKIQSVSVSVVFPQTFDPDHDPSFIPANVPNFRPSLSRSPNQLHLSAKGCEIADPVKKIIVFSRGQLGNPKMNCHFLLISGFNGLT